MSKGRERSQKWYFKNEKEVMKDIGLTPAKGSGSGWVEKEDGENDYIIAQLKSTDKESYRINQLDIEKLEYHATVSNKIPLFIIQFLNKDSRYALVALEDIPMVAQYLTIGQAITSSHNPLITSDEHVDNKPKVKPKQKIKSDPNARQKFFDQKQKAFEERKWNK
jgi:hypothetical protein